MNVLCVFFSACVFHHRHLIKDWHSRNHIASDTHSRLDLTNALLCWPVGLCLLQNCTWHLVSLCACRHCVSDFSSLPWLPSLELRSQIPSSACDPRSPEVQLHLLLPLFLCLFEWEENMNLTCQKSILIV